uniref:Uncharacterized protein n=1 Tax=Rhizophora mucronata TaxID=61149 RepID=A0A2P2PWM3_RHIMU
MFYTAIIVFRRGILNPYFRSR